MRNKMGQIRQFVLGDASASEPHDAKDSSSAEPTDSQILNEQELRDILESDTVAVADLSSNDGQGDDETIDLTDTFVSYNELTAGLKLREAAAQTRREAAAREDKERNLLKDTTGIKVYPFERTRSSWMQRISNWFMGG